MLGNKQFGLWEILLVTAPCKKKNKQFNLFYFILFLFFKKKKFNKNKISEQMELKLK